MQTYWPVPGSSQYAWLPCLLYSQDSQSPVAEEILSFLNVEKWSVSLFQGNSKQLLKEEGGQEQFHPGALWIKNWILVYSSFMVRVKLGWGGGQGKKGLLGPF